MGHTVQPTTEHELPSWCCHGIPTATSSSEFRCSGECKLGPTDRNLQLGTVCSRVWGNCCNGSGNGSALASLLYIPEKQMYLMKLASLPAWLKAKSGSKQALTVAADMDMVTVVHAVGDIFFIWGVGWSASWYLLMSISGRTPFPGVYFRGNMLVSGRWRWSWLLFNDSQPPTSPNKMCPYKESSCVKWECEKHPAFHEKTRVLYFPLNPGCLIEILIMVYYNPHIAG